MKNIRKSKIEKVSDIKEEIKEVPKEKTLAQKLLPGILMLTIATILGLSLNQINLCNVNCLFKGGGIGTIILVTLYIIGKALKDYGFY